MTDLSLTQAEKALILEYLEAAKKHGWMNVSINWHEHRMVKIQSSFQCSPSDIESLYPKKA